MEVAIDPQRRPVRNRRLTRLVLCRPCATWGYTILR